MARRLIGAAAALLILSGAAACDDDPGDATRNSEPTTESPDVTDSQQTASGPASFRPDAVNAGIRQVAESLRGLGLTPRFAFASHQVCAGGEADTVVDTAYSYAAQGRMDYPLGTGGSAAAAQSAVKALRGEGWTPRNDDWAKVGIHTAGEDRWSLYLDRDDVTARVDLRAEDPIVLISVSGPCLVPADGQDPELVTVDVDLPGMVPLSDEAAEDAEGNPLPGR